MSTKDISSEVAFLARELKTPVIGETFTTLADQARDAGWSHEEYLAAVLGRQVASRTANGARLRIAAARFPAPKTLEDFTFDHVPQATRDVIAHLGTTTFTAKRENVVLLGPPGTGKTHLAIALGIKAAHASYPVLFDSATGWVNRLAAAHATGQLERELKKLNRYRGPDHRRGRLPAPGRVRGELVLPAHRRQVRDRVSDRDLEPALRAMGRDPRR